MKARGRATAIYDFVISEKIGILSLTETWLTDSSRDDCALANIGSTLPNYVFHHVPRSRTSGGGVGILAHRGFDLKLHQCYQVNSFEYMDICVTSPNSPSHVIRLLVIYRPSYSRKRTGSRPAVFLEEFTSLLESLQVASQRILFVRDLNFHMDVKDNPDSLAFKDLLDLFNLQNHVTFPTHLSGHTLDLVISDAGDHIVSGLEKHSHLPSDHAAVICTLRLGRPQEVRKHLLSRNMKNINFNLLQRDLSKRLEGNYPDGIDLLVDLYNMSLEDVLKQHAPVKDRHVIRRPNAPYYNESLRLAKQERRRCERRMLKSKTEIYRTKCKRSYEKLAVVQSSYFRDKIESCDSRKLFQTVQKLTTVKPNVLPPHTCAESLANEFADFPSEL
ncbi:uncharacterized protein LOC121430719 [Lytechinus variegatus]|uniref:uncharacterized protein LOC121430719 n=1 Tax=Lytechinus variegatus TaxID=7654 RepID=UPI001BB12F4A|nr:uncharacterized protein LOC121430719 [Lytechinus variegatus]